MIERLVNYQQEISITIIGFDLTTTPYSYQIEVRQNNNKLWTIQRTLQEINQFYEEISQSIFQLQKNFQYGKLSNQDPKKTQTQLNIQLNKFFKNIVSRIDVVTNHAFRRFFQFPLYQKNLEIVKIEQQIQLSNQQYQCLAFAWEQKDQVIFTAYNKKKKADKITNFLKTLLSKDVKQGLIRCHQKIKQQWTQKWQIKTQGQPIQLNWSRKSNMLAVATDVGIYIYRVHVEQNYFKSEIFDYTAVAGIQGIVYDPLSSITYAFSKQIIYIYSQKNEELYRPVTSLINVSSIVLNKEQGRLIASDKLGIHLFDISRQNFCVYIHCLPADTTFSQLIIGGKKSQYLFGLSLKGYITVYQLKQKGKQKLISVLTNIQCAQNSSSLRFCCQTQLLFLNYKDNLCLINTKNLPIYSISNSKESIKQIQYDQKQQRVIVLADNVTTYKFFWEQ